VLPPIFDSPTTRGLFDPRTGVYWAADAFGAPVTHEVLDIRELDPEFFRESYLTAQTMISLWHRWLDPQRYADHVARVRALGPEVIASAHGTTLRGPAVDLGFDLLAEVPGRPPMQWPGAGELAEAQAAFERAVAEGFRAA
jgi:hypothetical protein